MYSLVTSPKHALDAIRLLNESLPNNPDLANRLNLAHAYYILERKGDTPIFGFSKFVGYKGLSPENYLRDYNSLDGRNTEHALTDWFEEINHGSPAYQKYFTELVEWMAQYDKRPRTGKKQKVRLMVLRPEFSDADGNENEERRLLDLMIAVSDLLPTNQRHELRSKL